MTHEDPDELLRKLGELPVHPMTASSAKHERAREAFARSFDRTPPHLVGDGGGGLPMPSGGGTMSLPARAALPVVLAAVVGLYLFWAFATAISLNR